MLKSHDFAGDLHAECMLIYLLDRSPTHAQTSHFHMQFAFNMYTAHLLDRASTYTQPL